MRRTARPPGAVGRSRWSGGFQAAGASVARGLPGRESGLDEGANGTDRDGFDQSTQSRRQHERSLPLRPRITALLWNPDQQLD
eukprot:12726856-Alexandrium_andersonii.AAC.1